MFAIRGSALHVKRITDAGAATVIALGTAGLFYAGVVAPRGVLDGVGYAALVPVCARFGRRAVIGWAGFSAVLICAVALLNPASGVSFAGDAANLLFSLLAVAVVAWILVQRLTLEHELAARDRAMLRNEEALRGIFRTILIPKAALETKIARLTEQSCKALDAQAVAIWQCDRPTGEWDCLDHYDARAGTHDRSDALRAQVERVDLLSLTEEGILVTPTDPGSQKAGAGMAAGVLLEGRPAGLVWFVGQAGRTVWTETDILFARALANIVTVLLLNRRNEQALAALDLVGEGLYATSRTGDVIFANRMATRIALTPDTDAGERDATLPCPDQPLIGDSDVAPLSFRGLELEIHRARLPDGGTITRIADVTGHSAAEREREYLSQRLQRAAKTEALVELGGGIAHEFNNIFGAITGFAGFIEEDLAEGSTDRQFASRILLACERGRKLVEQIQDFSRARVTEHTIMDLTQIIEGAAGEIARRLGGNIVLETEIPQKQALVKGCAAQLAQMLVNLLDNTVDAIGAGQGKITLSLSPVCPSDLQALQTTAAGAGEIIVGTAGSADCYHRIAVRDTGEGIAAETISRIFDPFYTTRGRPTRGGLGLAVVHGIVDSHGGVCVVRSLAGEGTTFTVFLPASSSCVEQRQAENLANCRGNERILVVDDEVDIVDGLVIGLCRLGYEAVGLLDAVEALQSLEEDPYAVDVLITDQVMPGLSGLELIAEAKVLNSGLRAILHTGFADGADEAEALAAGADGFLRKPAEISTIGRCIRGVVDNPAEA